MRVFDTLVPFWYPINNWSRFLKHRLQMIWLVLVLMSSVKYSFFLVNEFMFMKKNLFVSGTISKSPPLWSPLSQEVSYARVTVVTQRSPERKHLSSSSRGRRDINRNCSKPLETRLELLTKAQKSPDEIWGAMFMALRFSPWCYIPCEMGNVV